VSSLIPYDTVFAVTTYAWVGWLVLTLVLGGLYVLTGHLGVLVYRRLARVYNMTVVSYWLGRLEKVGIREFQRAQAEDRERAEKLASKVWDKPL